MSISLAPLQHALFNNKRVKLAALVLAIITWYAIRESINFEIEVTNIPVSILLDEGWAVLERSTDTVDVRFRGSQRDIGGILSEQVLVEIDLRGAAFEGSRDLPISSRLIRAPGGARPISVSPEVITISLDQEGEKLVPVKADILGPPPLGHDMARVVSQPAAVTLYGPRQRLGSIEEVRTSPIDLEGRLQSFTLRTSLVSPSPTWVARMEPNKVTVDVTIEERSSSKSLDKIPVRVLMGGDTRGRFKLSPKNVQVNLKGRAGQIDEIDERALHAYVDVTGLEAQGEYELPVRVNVSGPASVESVVPPSVKVRFRAP